MDTIRLIYETICQHIPDSEFAEHTDKLKTDLDFLQPGIPEDNSDGYIAFNVIDKPRMKLRTARFLTRKLSLNSGFLSDDKIQQIAEKINLALFNNTLSVELICGSDITKAYKNGIGNGSCMTGNCSEYTLLYEMNPSRFQMLVMYQFNTSARAIVHKLDNGEYYLDRIYSDSQILLSVMWDYAKDHGWHYRDEHGCPSCSDNILKVSDLNWEDGHVPYMDTMTSGEIIDNGKLTISAHGGDLELRSTDGHIQSESCDDCGTHIDEDHSYSGPDGEGCYCESCYQDRFTTCDYCSETVAKEDTVFLESESLTYCSDCAEEHAWRCDKCNAYFTDKKGIIAVRNVGNVCESCAEDYSLCDCCEEYHDKNSVATRDGETICRTCAKNYQLCETCGKYTQNKKCCGKNLPIEYPGQQCLPNT